MASTPPNPHPKVLSLHFQYLLTSLSNGRQKNSKEKVPEALKGFHCSEHLGGWLSGEVVGGRALRDSESLAEFSITASSRNGACPCEGGSLETEASGA